MGQALVWCGGGQAGNPGPMPVPTEGLLSLLVAWYDKQLVVADHFMEVRLFQNDITPGPASVFADFDEADFDGYAMVEVEMNAPDYDTDGNPIIVVPSAVFNCNGATTPNTIYGYYMVGGVSGEVILAERFTLPQPVVASGDTITVSSVLKLSNIPEPEE